MSEATQRTRVGAPHRVSAWRHRVSVVERAGRGGRRGGGDGIRPLWLSKTSNDRSFTTEQRPLVHVLWTSADDAGRCQDGVLLGESMQRKERGVRSAPGCSSNLWLQLLQLENHRTSFWKIGHIAPIGEEFVQRESVWDPLVPGSLTAAQPDESPMLSQTNQNEA